MQKQYFVKSNRFGFTIVELLVVIVVIGILATITIVSYTGISTRAISASLQSDLAGSANVLKMFNEENGVYPTSFTLSNGQYCPTPTDSRYCLKASGGNSYFYTSNSGADFVLVARNGNLIYQITSDGGLPTTVTPTPITAIADIQGDYAVGSVLSPGALTPGGATATYQWQISTAQNGSYSDISGASSDTYTVASGDVGKFIKVVATGSGLYTGIVSSNPTTVITSAYWKQLASGNNAEHTCGISSSGKGFCFGLNGNGQLGNNSTTSGYTPVAVSTSGVLNGKTIKSMATGRYFTCAIASDNLAYCWGMNTYGQLGNGTTNQSLVPVAVDTSGVLNGLTIKSITAGANWACVVASDNNAYCWGDNGLGYLGDNTTTQRNSPVAVLTSGVLSGKTVTAIAAGSMHTCAIASSQAYCWGNGSYGRLGDGTGTQYSYPVAVNTSGVLSGKTILSIKAGGYTSCAIASDNNAYCWGFNDFGQVGDNTSTYRYTPVAVYTSGALSGKTIKAIAAGMNQKCAIASDDQAYCWGYGVYGDLGNNALLSSSQAMAVYTGGNLNGKTIKSITSGVYHVCVIASDNQGYCWGQNTGGQLGSNNYTNISVPMQVISPPS